MCASRGVRAQVRARMCGSGRSSPLLGRDTGCRASAHMHAQTPVRRTGCDKQLLATLAFDTDIRLQWIFFGLDSDQSVNGVRMEETDRL
jgi:hypothetical protein